MIARSRVVSTQGASAARPGDQADGKRLLAKPLSSESRRTPPISVAHDARPAEPRFVGVDVSKSWIDIADTAGRKQRVANEPRAIAAAFAGA
jgi:hypothetical protein